MSRCKARKSIGALGFTILSIVFSWLVFRAWDAEKQNRLNRKVRAVMEDRSCAFVLVNKTGIVEEWPPRMERITGWDYDEAIGRNISFIVPPEHRDKHTKGFVCDPRRWNDEDAVPRDFACQILSKSGERVGVRITIFEALNRSRFVAIVLPEKKELHRIKAKE